MATKTESVRIQTIKNIINPAVMPGYSELAGMIINTSGNSEDAIIDNIPARSIISVHAQSQVTADASSPAGRGFVIANGTKAGTKKITIKAIPTVSTCSYVIKYSESEVITPVTHDDDFLLYPLQ